MRTWKIEQIITNREVNLLKGQFFYQKVENTQLNSPFLNRSKKYQKHIGLLNLPEEIFIFNIPPSSIPKQLKWNYNNKLSLCRNRRMQYINTRPLSFIVHRVMHSSRLEAIFREINDSCQLNLKYECPQIILAVAKRINEREVHENNYKPSPLKENFINWVFGEFKIFVWVVVYKCLINGLQLQNLTIDIAKKIQNIFKSKSLFFIQYEIKVLISHRDNIIPDLWHPEEIELLSSIMGENEENSAINWRSISFKLFIKSNGQYFRNLNHCREKWLNHLNPHVKKGGWTTEEDIKIFSLINVFGLKWSKISQSMGKTRTEHMVKNRFNKYYRSWKLNNETTLEYIHKLFKEKIENPYIRKQKRLNEKCQNEEVETIIKVEEIRVNEEGIKDQIESQNAKDNFQHDHHVASVQHCNRASQQLSKVVSVIQPIQMSLKGVVKSEPNNEEPDLPLYHQNQQKATPRATPSVPSKSWNYYPFLNLYYPTHESQFYNT